MTSPHFTHIDHLGIAVANLAEAEARYTAMFGMNPTVQAMANVVVAQRLGH